MKGFFKKFVGDSTRGELCKNCGHSEISHHLKVLEPDHTQAYNNKAVRLNCRECSCTEFK